VAKEGWLTIRNVPDLADRPGNAYFQELKLFFEDNTLCPKCKGKGSRCKKDMDSVETTTVRFGSIAELEQLKGMKDISMADIIRDILERQVMQKVSCSLCKGSRFVDRVLASDYKSNKLKMKKIKDKKKKIEKKRKRLGNNNRVKKKKAS